MKNDVDVHIDSILNIPLYDKSTKECHVFLKSKKFCVTFWQFT